MRISRTAEGALELEIAHIMERSKLSGREKSTRNRQYNIWVAISPYGEQSAIMRFHYRLLAMCFSSTICQEACPTPPSLHAWQI